MAQDPETVEFYRQLRLRSNLTQAHRLLQEAVAEITISDEMASNVLSAELDCAKALEVVLSSIQVIKAEKDRGVK